MLYSTWSVPSTEQMRTPRKHIIKPIKVPPASLGQGALYGSDGKFAVLSFMSAIGAAGLKETSYGQRKNEKFIMTKYVVQYVYDKRKTKSDCQVPSKA